MTSGPGAAGRALAPWLVAALAGAGWALVGAIAVYLGIYFSVGGFPPAIWIAVAVVALVYLASAWWFARGLGVHHYLWTLGAAGFALSLQIAVATLAAGISPVAAFGLFVPIQAIAVLFALLGTRLRRTPHR